MKIQVNPGADVLNKFWRRMTSTPDVLMPRKVIRQNILVWFNLSQGFYIKIYEHHFFNFCRSLVASTSRCLAVQVAEVWTTRVSWSWWLMKRSFRLLEEPSSRVPQIQSILLSGLKVCLWIDEKSPVVIWGYFNHSTMGSIQSQNWQIDLFRKIEK